MRIRATRERATRRRAGILSIVVAACAATGPGRISATVQGTPTVQETPAGATVHPEAREAIEGVWSPYCPGLMLEVCTSAGGAMLRDSIQRMAEAGFDADSIIELVLADYGEEYRAAPRSEGFGGLAWYVPPAALVVGLIAVAVFLSRRRGRSAPAITALERLTEAEENRLREAMDELERNEAPDF